MRISRSDYDAIEAVWKRENNRGNGYAVGDENDDINRLERDLGAKLVWRSGRNDELAIYQNRNGSFTAVGDVHGPWACDVPKRVIASVNPRNASEDHLRDAVIKLAYEKPQFRDVLLPLVVKDASREQRPMMNQTALGTRVRKMMEQAKEMGLTKKDVLALVKVRPEVYTDLAIALGYLKK